FSSLPPTIIKTIFQYLTYLDLLTLPQICKSWKNFCSESKLYNNEFWSLCMKSWYEPSQRPTKMTSKDSKINWKEKFLKLGIRTCDQVFFPLVEKPERQ